MTASTGQRKRMQPGERYGEMGQIEVVGWLGHYTGVTRLYTVKCHICAEDEELWGNAEFLTQSSNLKGVGAYPCGCGRNPRWTKAQYKVHIDRHCKKRNYTYVGHIGEWRAGKTLLTFRCNIHDHEWSTTTANGAKNNDFSCPLCSDPAFKRDKPAHFYVLKITGESGDFTGFGISGILEERLKYHRRELGKCGFHIDEAESFPMWGYEAEQLEREVMKEFERNKQKVTGFRTEATHSYLYMDVIAYAEEFLQRISDESKLKNSLTNEDKTVTI